MKSFRILSIGLVASFFVACTGNPTNTMTGFSTAEVDSMSIAVGHSLGFMVNSAQFGDLNNAKMISALKEVMANPESFTEEQMMEANQYMQQFMQKKSVAIAEANIKEGQAFLAENKTKPGVIETPTGLQYKITQEGNEVRAGLQDTVEVHYRGTLLDGTEFDSSYKRGEPAKFPLDRVIKGWGEGIQYIGEGGKATLYIPGDLAYGQQGAGNDIGPNATLMFDVELIKVYPKAK